MILSAAVLSLLIQTTAAAQHRATSTAIGQQGQSIIFDDQLSLHYTHCTHHNSRGAKNVSKAAVFTRDGCMKSYLSSLYRVYRGYRRYRRYRWYRGYSGVKEESIELLHELREQQWCTMNRYVQEHRVARHQRYVYTHYTTLYHTIPNYTTLYHTSVCVGASVTRDVYAGLNQPWWQYQAPLYPWTIFISDLPPLYTPIYTSTSKAIKRVSFSVGD